MKFCLGILILNFVVHFGGTIDPNSGQKACEDLKFKRYRCVPSGQCVATKCITDEEEGTSDGKPADDICSNQEQVEVLRNSCPDIRSIIDDDEAVCCHPDNIMTPEQQRKAQQQTSSTESPSQKAPGFGPKCGLHTFLTVDPRSGVDLDTFENEWPHMCAIYKWNANRSKKSFLAGGSLIAPGVILTVAHWVYDLNPVDLKIHCGVWNLTSSEFVERDVTFISWHPAFERATVPNDFALLHLRDDFELNDKINVICLPTSRDIDEELDNDCVALGWGHDSPGDSSKFTDTLKQIRLPMIDNIKCQQMIRKEYGDQFVLHPSFICAGGVKGLDTCRGDGGGPLVCKRTGDESYVQAGIVSWGIACGLADLPGIYASTAYGLCFIDWATKCIHGDKYQDFYDIKECEGWHTKEKDRLKKQISKFKSVLSNPQTKPDISEFALKEQPKHEAALINLQELEANCINTMASGSEFSPRRQGQTETSTANPQEDEDNEVRLLDFD